MQIRLANDGDVKRLQDMLYTVQNLHANGRPDVFIHGTRKYDDEQVRKIISCPNSPIFVGEIGGVVMAYAFCEINESKGTQNLRPLKTLYIDDLCVDENYRGKGYGQKMYAFVREQAKIRGCYHLTLNVWHLNESAVRFYEKLGMKPLKTTMEDKL